jgi:hypothetical protein
MQHVYFPVNWSAKWPEFFKDITGFQKEAKNKHDDAADALTGLAEIVNQDRFEFMAIGADGGEINMNPAGELMAEMMEI